VRRAQVLLPGLLIVVASGASASAFSSDARNPSTSPGPDVAAKRFLATYVTGDGRVLRRDQGGDIVSEGQAYGMLIAEAAGDPNLARTIWNWTRRHLQLTDGLFAWLARGGGRIESTQSATDADVLLAFALLRYGGVGASSLHRAGRAVARAVLANESVRLADGDPVLVAGPWAKSATPPIVDPSYFMPAVFDDLARWTGDARWSAAATSAISLVKALTSNGERLPPDWATLTGASLVATPASGTSRVQYGLDAQRLPLWFASACQFRAREIAASWWRHGLSRPERSGALALSLDGKVLNSQTNPLPLLASAAAASAAGEGGAARALRARATAVAASTPTYYGGAWLALAQVLRTRSLTTCSLGDGSGPDSTRIRATSPGEAR
jgi:endo-1,4-beta-D-glucanase Y